VAEVTVLDYRYVDNATRYVVSVSRDLVDVRRRQVHQHRGGRASLAEREFVWVNNVCRCPTLHIGDSYVLIGRLAPVDGDGLPGGPHGGPPREPHGEPSRSTGESRLQLTDRSVALPVDTWRRRFADRNFKCQRRR